MKHKIKLAIILAIEFSALAMVLVLIFLAGKKQYTVTFDLNGGMLIGGSTEQTVTQGNDASPPSVVKEGHYLLGWSGSYKKVTHDVEVSAIWEYETTPGVEYQTKSDATYTEISGCFKSLGGKVYIGAYHKNLKVFSILDSAFESCNKITGIYLLDGILTIGDRAFAECSSLEAIELPMTAVSIGDGAFENCRSLKKIVLPEDLEELGAGAFSGCISLEEVYIPSSIKHISEDAFLGCEKLKRVVFVDYDEDKEEKLFPDLIIDNRAFSGCKALERINLPETLATIREGAFLGCESLMKIVIPKSTVVIEANVFSTAGMTIYTYYGDDAPIPEGFDQKWISEGIVVLRNHDGTDIYKEASDSEAEE